MKAKYLKLAGGSILAAMLLAGCGSTEEDPAQDPAVEETEESEDEADPTTEEDQAEESTTEEQ